MNRFVLLDERVHRPDRGPVGARRPTPVPGLPLDPGPAPGPPAASTYTLIGVWCGPPGLGPAGLDLLPGLDDLVGGRAAGQDGAVGGLTGQPQRTRPVAPARTGGRPAGRPVEPTSSRRT